MGIRFFLEMIHGLDCYQNAGYDLMLCTHSIPGTWILLIQVNTNIIFNTFTITLQYFLFI